MGTGQAPHVHRRALLQRAVALAFPGVLAGCSGAGDMPMMGGNNSASPGMGPIMGDGMMDASMMADMQIIMDLLNNHQQIARTVADVDGGIVSCTTSTDARIAGLIGTHVAAMKTRIEQDHPIRQGDLLFAEIFKHHTGIHIAIEPLPAWSKAPTWTPWAAEIDDALMATLTNLADRNSWMRAADVLVLVVRSGSSSIMDRVLRALVSLDEADRGDDSSQDRSALARVRVIAARMGAGAAIGDPSLDRATLAEAARYLAGYEPAAAEAPRLRLAAIAVEATASDAAHALGEVADLLLDRPVAAADLANDVHRLAERHGWSGPEIAEIAEPLLRRGDAGGGFLALALADHGRLIGWAEPYRGLVLRLRAHPVADVRAKAYATSVIPT